MRVLMLTNYYPPNEIGGEELSCRDTAHALRARGHRVTVLTSHHRTGSSENAELDVHRVLYPEMELGSPFHPLRFFLTRRQRERKNLIRLRALLRSFCPDIVMVWGAWNLPRSLLAEAEALAPERVVYRFGDFWPTLPTQHELYWRGPRRREYAPIKLILAKLALAQLEREKPLPELDFRHAYCISDSMRRELVARGVPLKSAEVIHNGIDTDLFKPEVNSKSHPCQEGILSILYAGRVVPDKGVHTAIEAVSLMPREGSCVTLTIVGPAEPAYESKLRALVTQARLQERVAFRSHVAQLEMPALLRSFDAMVVPSIWPEPFGRVVIEAMASGLPVLCTPVGGVTEIVTSELDGLYFAPGDASALAAQAGRLARDCSLRHRLATAARQTVMQRFSLTATIERVEAYLAQVDERAGSRTSICWKRSDGHTCHQRSHTGL